MGRTRDEISGSRGDHDYLRFSRQTNVIQGMAGSEDLAMNRSSGNGFEGDSPDELARRASHHDIHLGAGLCKQTRQPHGLVAGDSPGDPEE